MSEKRELVLKAFRGESVDRVPVGFWHHFTTEDEWLHGFENPEIIDKNKAGHKKFIEEINTFCTLNYHTTFPRFAKIKVNGKEAEPLFDWLKQEKSGPPGARIEWNFTKFLINREGQVVERFSSKTDPLKMEDAIKALLNN